MATKTPRLTSVSAARKTEQQWLDELALGVESLAATQRYRDWLNATAHHWRYSPMNCALIHLQRGRARLVAGREAWRKRGRTVRRGARPISILAPAGGGGFVCVKVYDLRDTDGPPLSVDSWTLSGGSRWLPRVEAAAQRLGITVRAGGDLGNASGVTTTGKVVTIAPGLSPAERTATLLHEYGHALLGHADEYPQPPQLAEAEAEGVAWVCARALGLRSAAPQYLAHLGVTAEALRSAFQRIAAVARDILGVVHGKRRRRHAVTPPPYAALRAMLVRSSRDGQ